MSSPGPWLDITGRWRAGRVLLVVGGLLALAVMSRRFLAVPRLVDVAFVLLVGGGLVTAALLASLRGRGPAEQRALYLFLALAARVLADETARLGFPSWPLPALVVALVAVAEDLGTAGAVTVLATVLAVTAAPDVPTALAITVGHGLLLVALHAAMRADRRRLEQAQEALARIEHGIDQLADNGGPGARVSSASSLRQLSEDGRRARRVDHSSDLQTALQRIVELARAATEAHAVLYFEVDRGRETAWLRASSGPESLVRDATVPLGADPFGFVLERRQAFYATDFKRLLWALPWYPGQVPVGSLVACPVFTSEVVAGVLVAERLEVQAFGEGDPGLLGSFAELCGHEILRARAALAREEIGAEFKAVYAVSREMSILVDQGPVRKLLLRSARELAAVDGGAVVATDETQTTYTVEEAVGWAKELEGRCGQVSDRTWAGWVLRGVEEALLLDDLAGHKDRMPVLVPGEAEPRPESLLVVPFRLANRTLGALVLTGRRGTFDAAVQRVMQILSNQAAAAIANLQLLDEASDRATRDGLTGLYNRRQLEEHLEETFANESRRPGGRFAVILLDVDHFKKLNDTYGHPAGDAALRAVAGLMKSHLRRGDTASRYGGEEFAVILPGADEHGAALLANRLRAALEAWEEVFAGARLRMTASFGVAVWPVDGADVASLLSAVDKALYAAKQGGRNRVVAASALRAV